jgi:hypothetical protein
MSIAFLQITQYADWKATLTHVTPIHLVQSTTHTYIMDVTFHQKHDTPRQVNYFHFASTIFHIKCVNTEEEGEACDYMYRSIILYLPGASVFYTRHAVANAANIQSVIPSQTLAIAYAIPLPANWLRLRYSDGQPAAGSYIRAIHNVWQYDIVTRATQHSPPPKNIRCFQFDDSSPGTPLLPPDLFGIGAFDPDVMHRRMMYREMLANSATTRLGCRHYVRSSLHSNISFDNTLIIDQREYGDVTLHVCLHDPNSRVYDNSSIHVRSAANQSELLSELKSMGKLLSANSNQGNCRKKAGDRGGMYVVGTMLSSSMGGRYEPRVMRDIDAISNGMLNSICVKSGRVAQSLFPDVLQSIRQAEKVAGLSPSDAMGGLQGVSVSMDVSIDLGNASHYDGNDCSHGYSIWTETNIGESKNWYFVLPNILVELNGKTYSGIAIRLFHGAVVSWDGRVIRHCTSLTDTGSKQNHVYGWFWASNGKMIDSGRKLS